MNILATLFWYNNITMRDIHEESHVNVYAPTMVMNLQRVSTKVSNQHEKLREDRMVARYTI